MSATTSTPTPPTSFLENVTTASERARSRSRRLPVRDFLVSGLVLVPSVVALWLFLFWIGGEFSR